MQDKANLMEFQQTLLRQKKPKLASFMLLNNDSSKTPINIIEVQDHPKDIKEVV